MKILLIRIIVTTTAILFAVVHMFGMKPFGWTLTIDEPLLVIAVFALLPWLNALFPEIVERIESFTALGAQITLVKRDVQKQSEELRELQNTLNRLTVFSLESDIFDTLENLDKQPSFTLTGNEGLLRRHFQVLFDRGFINRSPDELKHGDEVGNGSIVTPLGKEYIKVRKTYQASGGSVAPSMASRGIEK